GGETYTLTVLFKDEQHRILNQIVESKWVEAEAALGDVYLHLIPVMRSLVRIGAPLTIPRAFYAVAEFAINSRLRREFASGEMNLSSVQSLIEDARKARVTLDAATLEYTLRMTLERIAQCIRTDHSDVEKLQQLDTAAGLARSLPFEVNLWKI